MPSVEHEARCKDHETVCLDAAIMPIGFDKVNTNGYELAFSRHKYLNLNVIFFCFIKCLKGFFVAGVDIYKRKEEYWLML